MGEKRLSREQARWVEQATEHVAVLANKMARLLPGMTRDDLRSAGYEALVRAAFRYDPAQGVPFSAYAHYRVRGAMIDASRRKNPEARRRNRAQKALETSQALLEQANKRAPPPGTPDPRTLRERVQAAADLVAQTTAAALMARLPPADPESVAGSEPTELEQQVDETRLRQRLRQAMAICEPDERALLDGLYVRGLSMHELAAERGVAASTVSRHHARILRKLARALSQPQSDNDR